MLALPPIIGHRGACAHAPENTLASFAKAADLGCAMVEFDVRLTADGVPIVFHDDTLQRRTNARGPVGARTLAELKRLDAGQGETIPTLAEVLALCLARGMAVNIELKPDHGAGKATARAALEQAAALWPSDRPAPLISSFDRDALGMAVQVIPGWPRGLLVERVPAQWRQLAEQFRCSAVCAHHRWLPAATVSAVTASGLAMLAYTVNRPGRAKALWKRGISAIFCDAPDRLL
ncbi:MAG: glycerophosphoryl diester phosphodiesterase [Rhodospirillaceae bacterium]|nr:glycerophosphoryl diester phosphodiesterase [Rhodospirillales bacterium]